MKYAITRVADPEGDEVVLVVELTQDLADRVGRYVAGVRALNCPEFLRASFWEAVSCFEMGGMEDYEVFEAVSDQEFTIVDAIDESFSPCQTETELLHVGSDGQCFWTFRQRHSNYRMATAYIDLLAVLAEQGIKPNLKEEQT